LNYLKALFQFGPLILLPLLISFVLTRILVLWAARLGLVDYPSARKTHTETTPKGGGIAIFLVVWTAMALYCWSGHPSRQMRADFQDELLIFLIPGAIVALLGLFDDFRPLPWQLRLLVQSGVAALVAGCWPGIAGLWWRVAAGLWIVGLTNAFNMLDNMDALSSGVAWLGAAFLVGALALRQPVLLVDADEQLVFLLMIFMGAVLGFLWHNLPPARIFMGDVGSTFIGFFLSTASLQLALPIPWTGDADILEIEWRSLVPLCILAVPCYDLTSVVLLRLSQGRSPFHADKQHLSHRLVELGLSSKNAVRVIYLLAIVSGLSGLALYFVKDWIGAGLVVGQLAGWWLALALIEFLARRARNQQPPLAA
jgi:UDP-GlcNAc:undecaprenyl-phosphate GlcNAc-1-phosphate transferase